MHLKFAHIYGPVLFTLGFGLFLDSAYVGALFASNQLLTNAFVMLVFAYVFSSVSPVSKKLMLLGVVISYGGEVVFALGLGMYTYRLENVPLYVPFGHALVYAAVYYMTKERWVRKHQKRIISTLYPIIIIYATLWLIFANDVFGFVCMLVILVLFHRRPETKIFFSLMFFMVVYLELVGTYYQCWHWPSIWFGELSWVPSANPPSGIGVVYFAFDAGCLLCYKYLNLTSWRRFRAIQRIAHQRS
ncbi:MAG: hypothetical protein AUK35_06765 [Zetaproteobacteria bacterium CG2_30_46_52]|nr:MAG: hypothetical protein AUK35_06765 [Zetaproteobacteria bacterium CG2_30_46_52]